MKKILQCADSGIIAGMNTVRIVTGLAVVLLHHLDEVKHLVAVTDLVVIP